METLNQNTPYNTTQSKTLNSISLEHNEPLVEHTLGKHPTLSSGKAEAISDPGSISTTNLFHKPIVFANNLEWNVTQAINTSIYTQPLVNIFEMLNISPGGQNLRGNTFFRSGAKIELKLTSSPFHSGKLVFYYVPPGVSTQFRESIFAKVQFPCVYVDAGNSTTGVLDIPFVTIKDFFSTVNPDGRSDFGTVAIAVVNPLRIGTGGPTSVQLALTLHPTQNQIALPVLAHDIQIQGLDLALSDSVHPTNQFNILDSQNPLDVLKSLDPHNLRDVIGRVLTDLFVPDEDVSKSSTRAMLMNPIDTSVKEPDTPKVLPKPQNPNNTTSTTKVNNSAPTLSNITGFTTEHMSLIPEKTVLFSEPSLEMNLKRVAQTPSLIRIGEWTDAGDSGTELFKVPVDPMIAPFLPTTGQSTGVYYPTFLSHVIEPFAFWRGSIDFHFSFASTDQHKGKVIAAWIPFDEINDAGSSVIIGGDPTIEQLSLFPNEIFDLSLNKEFSFSVPYNSETPFRQVSDYNTRVRTDDGNIQGEVFTDYSLGTLYLNVYNKLSHPSTVSSTINFNVYVKAGQDFQFRALKFNNDGGNQYQRINYVTLQGLDVVYESTREGMARERPNRVGIISTGLTKTSFQEDDSEEHLGVLLQKYYPQFGYNITLPVQNTSTVSISSVPGMSFRTTRNTDPTLNPDPRWRNLIAHFRDIYAFWQGSLNYFILHNSTVNNPVILMASHDPTDYAVDLTPVNSGQASIRPNTYYIPASIQATPTAVDVDLSETSVYSHISNIRVNPTIEITTPHRSLYRRLYTSDFREAATSILDQDRSIGTIDLVYSNPSGTEQSISALVYQSVGDDFQFKYLIPPPSLKSRR
ncbi:hypothetical protein 2 [Hubei picorna-like virus 78]|uniref:hypothetical protein 2 n=1 Tax=Hubei picorna-like virus 78 TaxID=1923162 RepID=UPI00090A134D|nr:hypothetical protein 2 [Hubei picorna-like virus 78]APG78433.1 hypothetical protein 2 [Hubei picorna-like virus 78]